MNWFSDLKVFHKIMLILVFYALALVINMFIGRSSLLETQDHLIQLEQTIYDSVQLSTTTRPLLQRADELLTQAVSFDEEDLKTQGEASVAGLIRNLKKLQEIDSDRIDSLKNIEQTIKQYRDTAVPIVEEMFSGEADFSILQEKITQKTTLFKQANLALDDYHSKIDLVFKGTISKAVKSGESSLFLTSAISLAFFTLIAVLITYIARTISNTASQLRDSLRELSEGSGDLTHRIEVSSNDELGMTATNFNRFMVKLSGIVGSIVESSSPLLAAANELDSNSKTVQQTTNDLLDKAREGKSSMEEITLSISEISQSATLASDAMQETEVQANQGLELVNNTIANSGSLNTQIIEASGLVEKLAQDTKNVASILDVISSIAEQTNLLALNAAIEAARAGDQGRGFAVVADEVRALASKTGDATTEIRDVLGRLETTATTTVSAMNSAKDQSEITEKQTVETGDSLNQIKAKIDDVNQMSLTIAAATEEQSIVVNNVSDIITNMYESVETTEQSYGQLASLAEKLLSSSDALKGSTDQFKT